MKFLVFSMFDVAKAAEIAQAADKVVKTPGSKILAQYICQGIPFAGVPPNMLVVVTVEEYESNEAIAATDTHWHLPGQPLGPCLCWRCRWVAEQQQKRNTESNQRLCFFTTGRAPS